MTLNEVIQWAHANNVDFDKIVFIPHANAIDIHRLEAQKRVDGKKGLVIHIF